MTAAPYRNEYRGWFWWGSPGHDKQLMRLEGSFPEWRDLLSQFFDFAGYTPSLTKRRARSPAILDQVARAILSVPHEEGLARLRAIVLVDGTDDARLVNLLDTWTRETWAQDQ